MKRLWPISVFLAASGISGITLGDEHNIELDRWASMPPEGIDAVDDPTYSKACGSCHFAYQPGLLPASSWEKLMTSLDNHFGQKVELSSRESKRIRNYLLNYAAGRSHYRLSVQFAATSGTEAPLRISETPYFTRMHREIPATMTVDNPQVASLSHCDACHTQADKGSYRAEEIEIPGHGPWTKR